MAKKTWIKVKRGILDPKHIEQLGQAWYLYFYILDQTEWESGTISDWKDKFAADDLCKPIALIREHRKLLQDRKYITCEQGLHKQKIIVHNWIDPRRYDGVVQNPEDQSADIPEPCDKKEGHGSGHGTPHDSGHGSGHGFKTPSKISHSSYSHMSHNTDHMLINESKSFVSEFLDTLQISIQTERERDKLADLLSDYEEEKLIKVANWYTQLPDRCYIAWRVLSAIQSAAEKWTDKVPTKTLAELIQEA